MAAYYNEFDKYAAQWLRNLIAAGHIAPGVVDERSIEDVHPDDLRGFTQCHFFAGIGVWSLALRRAGWPDDRPVWTGSCPCQPFSEAGQGAGFDDERHLWPHFHWLISQRRPAVVIGEQVASKDAAPWLDLVALDLEALGFAFGAVAFPSSSVGAPHIRDRTYWMANSSSTRLEKRLRYAGEPRGTQRRGHAHAGSRPPSWMEHAGQHHDASEVSAAGTERPQADRPADQLGRPSVPPGAGAGPTNGVWRNADWLLCRDAKWRPVEPGTFPLAHGAPARVGRLRAYGNAINAEAARIFIECVMDAI
ncbi:DNA cytosine methyltransferase [Paracidovorax wautersii]|uniref:DNA (Cytosine-5)-methyltransferase 1 n=1 Tax=Paracidovorax wautersii TaxID=1177982 RepID=A0ABU1IHC8_9BURK|nr:DNA cytosine methyltransferase [Paracidovorax wautersii]MDR6216227.1 DNA (cytosine-5)-methyltransferase 1 [Paracidovorax wautersii]